VKHRVVVRKRESEIEKSERSGFGVLGSASSISLVNTYQDAVGKL